MGDGGKRIVLAVDGGNSKTLAAVADEDGAALAIERGGGSNFQTIGKRAAGSVLSALVDNALSAAGAKKVDVACYGIAGADREADFETVRGIIAPFDPAGESILVNDTSLALRAGTDHGVGVALIGGAGSNCIGRDERGRIRKAGGLGPLSGDRANASSIALDAIALAIKGADGRGPKTLLEDELKKELGLESIEDVIEFEFHDAEKRLDPGGLAPLVFAAADRGDEVALELLRDHGRSAGQAALAVLRGLFDPGEEVPLVLGGGVLQKGGNPALVETIRAEVMKEFPRVRFIVLEHHPLAGGVLMALDRIKGEPVTGAAAEKVKREIDRAVREENRDGNGGERR